MYHLPLPWASKNPLIIMSRREVPYAPRVTEDMEIHQADGNFQQNPSLRRRWSETDDEYFARIYYSRSLAAESRQDGVNQEATWIPGYSTDPYGEPYLPPPAYDERDNDLGEGERLPNYLFNMYPNEGHRPDYVTDSTGRRERYIIDERGERVAWPLPDHVDTSDDDEDSDMVHLESGRVIPRSEWEADHQWEPSSEEPSDGSDEEFSQRHRSSIPQSRTRPYSTSAREYHDREVARIRSGYTAGARRSRWESHPRYSERFHHMARERSRPRDRRPGRNSGHY